MTRDGEGSVTRLIDELRDGDDEAARKLWGRYFAALVRLARDRLRTGPRASADEEDVALSAFDSFFAAAARGRFPRLEDRNDLWRLLLTITDRKAIDLIQRERRQKRGGGLVRGEAELAMSETLGDVGPLAQVPGREPSPEFAALVADQCRQLLDALGDESLRQVALAKLEGCTDAEVATRLGCARRTVVRRLDLIRKIWQSIDA
jgi:DNA-directed RNA polymerase specialized sigma24 family protein